MREKIWDKIYKFHWLWLSVLTVLQGGIHFPGQNHWWLMEIVHFKGTKFFKCNITYGGYIENRVTYYNEYH